MCRNPKSQKYLLKHPILGVKGHSKSSKFTFLTSSLPVLVLLCLSAASQWRKNNVLEGCLSFAPSFVGTALTRRHHHRQPWVQHPLVSHAIVTIAAHRCLSRAAWLNSCRVAPHYCSMSSTILGEAVLFCLNHPSFRTPGSLSFCCRSFYRYGRKGATFSVSLSAVGFLSIESFCTILH